VVYDGSSKLVGPSLNQSLYEGPCLLPELFRILLRFRCRKYAVVGDLEKAFLQIEIDEADRDYLRTLWVANFDPQIVCDTHSVEIVTFRFTRCVFGVTSSPFHLLAVLRHHTEKYRECSSDVVDELQDCMYVDDFVSGADTMQGAFELFTKARLILKDGGFNLRKFASNSKELTDMVEKDSGRSQPECSGDLSYVDVVTQSVEMPRNFEEQKILGMLWNMEADELIFRFDSFLSFSKSVPMTKRGLLQLLARVYDPLGLLSPMLSL
jgi:hypothetical protein